VLANLAAAVGRLRPDWRDAEAFYELRSEIMASLRRLAHQLAVTGPAPRTLPLRIPQELPRVLPLRIPRELPRVLAPLRRPAVQAPSAAPTALPRPRRLRRRRHSYPRPPQLSLAVQPQLFAEAE
jgi:hypothetical protein